MNSIQLSLARLRTDFYRRVFAGLLTLAAYLLVFAVNAKIGIVLLLLAWARLIRESLGQ